jgi:hypothetical protein
MDHSFKVVNHYGDSVLITESWMEASSRYFRENDSLVNVGYEPNYTLWIVESNGDEYKLTIS